MKEPSSSSSSSAGSAPKSSAFSFTDVDATTVNGTGSTAGSSGDSAAGPGGPAGDGMMTSMLENMLRNPQMQTMLYPYLPEPMRNPQSIEWMLSNPEVKKQMEQMFAQSGMSMSPQMMDMMKTMDFSQDKVGGRREAGAGGYCRDAVVAVALCGSVRGRVAQARVALALGMVPTECSDSSVPPALLHSCMPMQLCMPMCQHISRSCSCCSHAASAHCSPTCSRVSCSQVNQQFAELGLNPQDVISKVMANPELASGFSNPKVQAAIMDISQNPMNITKYQGDPEVMKVLEKVTEIFSPQMQQAQQ